MAERVEQRLGEQRRGRDAQPEIDHRAVAPQGQQQQRDAGEHRDRAEREVDAGRIDAAVRERRQRVLERQDEMDRQIRRDDHREGDEARHARSRRDAYRGRASSAYTTNDAGNAVCQTTHR